MLKPNYFSPVLENSLSTYSRVFFVLLSEGKNLSLIRVFFFSVPGLNYEDFITATVTLLRGCYNKVLRCLIVLISYSNLFW